MWHINKWNRLFKWDENGKGKEYCDKKLIFKGEYANGIRNEKGEEYWNK